MSPDATTRGLQIYAELAKWYELHLDQISKHYPGERDYPGVIARKALAERQAIINQADQA